MNYDGSGLTTIYSKPGNLGFQPSDVVVDTDLDRIFFSVEGMDTISGSIWSVNTNGTNATQLLPDANHTAGLVQTYGICLDTLLKQVGCVQFCGVMWRGMTDVACSGVENCCKFDTEAAAHTYIGQVIVCLTGINHAPPPLALLVHQIFWVQGGNGGSIHCLAYGESPCHKETIIDGLNYPYVSLSSMYVQLRWRLSFGIAFVVFEATAAVRWFVGSLVGVSFFFFRGAGTCAMLTTPWPRTAGQRGLRGRKPIGPAR